MFNTDKDLNVAIYVRVSTEMQEEKDSLTNQINRCKGYCEMKDWNIINIYQDVESGAKDNRPDFLRLLADMKLGIFKGIVVTELSRVSRRMPTLIKFLEDFQACGVSFVSITQNIDTSTPMGKAFFQLTGVFAEFERDQTRERVSHTMKNMAANGKFTGGVVPFGYTLVDKKLVINEEEADTVREAFNLYLSGVNRNQISQRTGINETTLARMLTTPFYTGKTVYNKRRTNPITGKMEILPEDQWIIGEGEHEAIIDEGTFNIAKRIYEENYTPYTRYEDNPNFLLSGLLRCYHGHKMYGHISGTGYRYYICYRNSSKYQNKERCTQYRINSDNLEKEVIEYILSLKEMEDKVNILNTLSSTEKSPQDKLKALEARKSSNRIKKSELLDLMLNKNIDKDMFHDKNEELEKELRNIEKEIQKLNTSISSSQAKITASETFYRILNSISYDKTNMELKQLLSLIIKEIRYVNDFEYQIIFNI